MAQVTINNKKYDVESLPKEAQKILLSIRLVNDELQRIRLLSSALQTAKNAYVGALEKQLADTPEATVQ